MTSSGEKYCIGFCEFAEGLLRRLVYALPTILLDIVPGFFYNYSDETKMVCFGLCGHK